LSTKNYMKGKVIANLSPLTYLKTLLPVVLLIQISGCVSDSVTEEGFISSYQKVVVDKGPQPRDSNEGLDSLRPSPEPDVLKLDITKDETTGKEIVNLTIDEAVKRALVSSPEISIVSYDPSIAKEDIIKAVAEFDPALFGSLYYEKQDNTTNTFSITGSSTVEQATSRRWETGIRQKGVTGAEWSLAYALTRNWDDLNTRIYSTRYEPTVAFQVKQPLLRDAWQELNLAGVNIAKLNYRVALTAFRKRAEDVSAGVISLYWALARARRDREIQQQLLDRTRETLKRVEDRKDIDATDVQIKQAETAVKSREAVLYQTEKQVMDVQDALVRLLSDSQINLLSNFEIVPISALDTTETRFEQSETLRLALSNNPKIQQARLTVEVAQINIDVAKRQRMPKLDLVAKAKMQDLARYYGSAQDRLEHADYVGYSLEIEFEIPLGGNRQRKAEYRKRSLEQRKAKSILQNTSDQLAAQVKEKIRLAETSYNEIQIQKDAVDAATIHLQAVEDTEVIRKELTPEFLLVKLQAQETLSNARRDEIKAITDYNTSLVRLAQSMGKVLDMRYVRKALPEDINQNSETGPIE